MTKRKRTPPPSPKLIGFAIPQSLTVLAAQCRELRQQAEQLAQTSQDPTTSIANDQDFNLAADAQLNAQLNATIPTQMQPLIPLVQTQNFGNAPDSATLRTNAFIPSHSDQDIQQSAIRNAEQQLGMINPAELQDQSSHMQFSQFAAPQHQQQAPYFDHSTSAQIRFDPYVAPSHPTTYFHTNTLPTSPQTTSNPAFALSSQSQPYNPYSSYVNPASTQYMNLNTNAYPSGNPYIKIAPGPHPNSPQQQSHQPQTSLPLSQNQPGYYRLHSSYWQAPQAMQGNSAMADANPRHHAASASISSSSKPHSRGGDDGNSSTTLSTPPFTGNHSHHQHQPHGSHNQNPYVSLDGPGSPYPDPAAMEMTGPGAGGMAQLAGPDGMAVGPGGGVFRNLTKERFGRYSVGGKLVGAGKEIYG